MIVWYYTAAPGIAPVQVPANDVDVSLGVRVVIDLAGKLQVLRGGDAVIDKIASRLRFFYREWFLDQRLGFPWYQYVLIKNADRRVVEILFRRAIQTTPGVTELVSLSLSFDAPTRKLFVNAVCKARNGYSFEMRQEPFDLVSKLAA